MGHTGVGKTCQPGGLVAGRTNLKNPPQVYHTHTPTEGGSLSPDRQPPNIHKKLLSYGSRNTKVISKSTKKC